MNLFEYVKQQDLSFNEKPFTEADAVVFSTIANIDLSAGYDGKTTLGTLLDKVIPSIDHIHKDEIKFLELIKNSPRYQAVEVEDLVYEINTDVDKQFGGILLKYLPKKYYLGFAGTGSSVTGYKEDLLMATQDIVPAQENAVAYLNRVARDLEGDLKVGGFSKGGNLAIFASSFAKDPIREKITQIYNHDGPGFTKLIRNEKKYKETLDKVKAYIPEGSIVGLLLEHDINFKIIRSDAPPLFQHNTYNWEFEGDHLKKVRRMSQTSKFLKNFQNRLMDETTTEDRRDAIDALFKVISQVEEEDFIRLFTSGMAIIPSLYKSIRDTKKKERKSLFSIFKSSRKAFLGSFKDKFKKKK